MMKKLRLEWIPILAVFFVQTTSGIDMTSKTNIVSAKIQSADQLEIVLSSEPARLTLADFSASNGLSLLELTVKGKVCRIRTAPVNVRKNYRISIKGAGERELQPDGILDGFISSKPLGCVQENGSTVFRLFAPRASKVQLELFEKHDDPTGRPFDLNRDGDGVWELALPRRYFGKYYGYRISGPQGIDEKFNPSLLVADPYSTAMVTRNHYLHPGKTLIPGESDFDWEGDAFAAPDMEDLVIYEMHVRDMTAHSSSGVDPDKRGTYSGLIEGGKRGGIDYIASLGVNAVELLPVHEFANIEIDYKNPMLDVYNDWNPYARNHWGYMTTGFFAPESYYASDGSVAPGGWSGTGGRCVDELKAAVKAFHKRGIAVVLDVVYNHVSNYDLNPFKYIDKKYYFRLDDDGRFLTASGCGNDFKTERPMARRLIVESLLYWMREYHVDGFRFDLASMLDGETLDVLTEETRKVNPKVILIAEPWGGGKYGQEEFSRRGWGAWNDRFRNGVKGQNPRDGLGFIFGRWQGGNTLESLRGYVCGTLKARGGPFIRAAHSVNYLESHDDQTLGDFIRLGTGEVKDGQVIADVDANVLLSPKQLALNKLGALFLFTSRGPVMIHEGQEFARSKVIAPTDRPDRDVGKIDHNSYNKDNETNWINYSHAAMNRCLVDYYRGLISLRAKHPAFRKSGPNAVQFLSTPSLLCLAYHLNTFRPEDPEFVVALNGDPDAVCPIPLPDGKWAVLADGTGAGIEKIRSGLAGEVRIPPSSGMVFERER
jgi:pullulanase/glycogen debranching enzyme